MNEMVWPSASTWSYDSGRHVITSVSSIGFTFAIKIYVIHLYVGAIIAPNFLPNFHSLLVAPAGPKLRTKRALCEMLNFYISRAYGRIGEII